MLVAELFMCLQDIAAGQSALETHLKQSPGKMEAYRNAARAELRQLARAGRRPNPELALALTDSEISSSYMFLRKYLPVCS